MKCAIDLVCFSLHQRGVAVLLANGAPGAARLPGTLLKRRESIDDAVAVLTHRVVPGKTHWHEQAGTRVVDGHPLGAHLTVTIVTGSPAGSIDHSALAWCSVSQLPRGLPACHRDAIAASLERVRSRADLSAIVFAMLSPEFTLTQLQRAYEVLLGRRLHKASFRRTILAARLVVATTSWRKEGRGRPARLYRRARRSTPAGADVPAAPFRAPVRRRRPRRDTTRA